MVESFRTALLDALEETGLSLSHVAAHFGISQEQLNNLRGRPAASTNVDHARSVAKFFGVTLDQFPDDSQFLAQAGVTELYTRLPDAELHVLKAVLAEKDGLLLREKTLGSSRLLQLRRAPLCSRL